MQLDDIRLLRMSRQYLFAPAEDELTVLQSLCGLQAQFYGNCLHALHLRCGRTLFSLLPQKRGLCAARCT